MRYISIHEAYWSQKLDCKHENCEHWDFDTIWLQKPEKAPIVREVKDE